MEKFNGNGSRFKDPLGDVHETGLELIKATCRLAGVTEMAAAGSPEERAGLLDMARAAVTGAQKTFFEAYDILLDQLRVTP